MFDPQMLADLLGKVPGAGMSGAGAVASGMGGGGMGFLGMMNGGAAAPEVAAPDVAGPAPDASSWATTMQGAGADGSMGPFQATNPSGFVDAFKGNLKQGLADKGSAGIGNQIASAVTGAGQGAPPPPSGGAMPDPAAGQQVQAQRTQQALDAMLPGAAGPFSQAGRPPMNVAGAQQRRRFFG